MKKLLVIIYIIILAISTTACAKIPDEVKVVALERLNSLRSSPYYDCIENKTFKKLSEMDFSKEELRSLTYTGQLGLEGMSIKINTRVRIIEAISDVLKNGKCVPTWGEYKN